MQAPGDLGEPVASPTVAKRHGDRDDLRPTPPWYAVEIAHELREEIVGIQFFDEQLQERPRVVELRGAGGEQPHHAGTKLFSPSLGLELLFRSYRVFAVTVDVVDQETDFAHGCTSSNPAQATVSRTPARRTAWAARANERVK
jgi:hypothetical protein